MSRNLTPSAVRRRQERSPGFLFRQMVNNRNEEERRRRNTDTTVTDTAVAEITRQHQGIYVLDIRAYSSPDFHFRRQDVYFLNPELN